MIKTTLQRALLLLSAAALLASCATSAPPPISSRQGAPISDLLGIRLDLPRDTVRTTLASLATLEREERRRHEVWTLTNDPRFASLIIGYTPEWNVRFVTAVAKPDGVAVHYDDVLDVATADHRTAGTTHTYTWKTGTPPYYVIAIGPAERLEYLSLKKEPQG
jgi:hypothetical protein